MRQTKTLQALAGLLLVCCQMAFTAWAQSPPDAYDAMLGYLSASSRVDGHVLAASSGAVRVNLAAGDMNLQSNLHGIAVGERASVQGGVVQQINDDLLSIPLHTSAVIAGSALSEASGLYSINQVAGSGNVQFSAVTATLAKLGIQEADDAVMAGSGAIPAGGTPSPLDQPGASRDVAVAATAMQGFRGVMQLNQVAGSANATGNTLNISVLGGP